MSVSLATRWLAPEADFGRLVWTAAIVVGASLPHWPELPVWIPMLVIGCVAWRPKRSLLTSPS